MSNAPILVTGGAGYIGSHITLALLAAGRQVVVLDDLSTGARDLVPQDAIFAEGNCGDMDFVVQTIRAHKINSVIHCAGSISVEESMRDPMLYYRNNTVNSRALIEACVKEKIQGFLFSSTATIYGHPEQVPIPETAKLQPINPYGSSKLMTEMMLADATVAYGLPYLILRYFNVAGADAAARSGQASKAVTHLIRRALHTALGHFGILDIFGIDWGTPDGTCLRDYVHVSDLADAHVLALDALLAGETGKIPPGRAINVGYGKGFSVREVVAKVEAVIGRKLQVQEKPRRNGDPMQLIADSSWLQQKLGWKPRFNDLGVIIGDALRWEQKRFGGKV